MQDRLNAGLMNARPTGNGRRQSHAHLPDRGSTVISPQGCWRSALRGGTVCPGADLSPVPVEQMLSSIRDEEIRAGTAHDDIDYHRLFVARDADLAGRFIANLGRVNALVLGAAGRFAMTCIDRLGAAR